MFSITYGKKTEEKFTKSWRICLQDACDDFIKVYSDMNINDFLGLFEETLDGLETSRTTDSITLELGMSDVVTIKVLYLTNNKAVIELNF